MDKQQLEITVAKVLDEIHERSIPLGISNCHIHLCAEDCGRLFPNHPVSEKKGLPQPGQYVAEQTVMLVGSKGQLKNVRLLGPLHSASQVEISRTDTRTLGVATPLWMSGNIQGTSGVRLVSPFAELDLVSGVVVARQHTHMSPLDVLILRVPHGDKASVATNGDECRLISDNVVVRVSPDTRLEMHTDTDEVNVVGADNS